MEDIFRSNRLPSDTINDVEDLNYTDRTLAPFHTRSLDVSHRNKKSSPSPSEQQLPPSLSRPNSDKRAGMAILDPEESLQIHRKPAQRRFQEKSREQTEQSEGNCRCAQRKTETRIFSGIYDTVSWLWPVDKLDDQSDSPALPSEPPSICITNQDSIQIYESIAGGKTRLGRPLLSQIIRRVVISYVPLNDHVRFCSSFWFPLTDLEFENSGSAVTVRWSDSIHMSESINRHYKRSITVQFIIRADADRFVDSLRLPYVDGITTRDGNRLIVAENSELHVYDTRHNDDEFCKVIVRTLKLQDFITTKVFLLYSDVDLDIEYRWVQEQQIYRYETVLKCSTLSTIFYRRERSYIKRESMKLYLGPPIDLAWPPSALVDVLHALSGWTLRYFATLSQFKEKTNFLGSREHGVADILVWQKIIDGKTRTQIALRYSFESDVMWKTGKLTKNASIAYLSDHIIKMTAWKSTRGRLLDVQKMTAAKWDDTKTYFGARAIPDIHGKPRSTYLTLTFVKSEQALQFYKLMNDFGLHTPANGDNYGKGPEKVQVKTDSQSEVLSHQVVSPFRYESPAITGERVFLDDDHPSDGAAIDFDYISDGGSKEKLPRLGMISNEASFKELFEQTETNEGHDNDELIADDDKSSETSTSASAPASTASSYFAQRLVFHKDMGPLCLKARVRLRRVQFIDEFCGILQACYRDLLEEGWTEQEQICMILLGSRHSRSTVMETVTTLLESFTTVGAKNVFQNKIANVVNDREHTPPEGRSQQDQNIDSLQAEDNSSDAHNISPETVNMVTSFLESEPFHILLHRLRVMLLPAGIKQIAKSISHDTFWISDQQDNSLINRAKAAIENYTNLEWNWWPLSPHLRALRHDETRLYWTCSCGTKLWKELFREDADLVQQTLPFLDVSILTPRCRVQRDGVGGWTLLEGLIKSVAPTSYLSQQYVSSGMGPSSSIAGPSVPSLGNGQTQAPKQGPSQQQQGSTVTILPSTGDAVLSSIPKQLWVLFGVKGARPVLELSHIPINDQTNDSVFYRSLRENYRLNRGKLRLWFSFWRLGYCDVVKFKRIAPKWVIMDRKELPLDPQYIYNPRPPDATNPPISRHEFSMHLNACDQACRWSKFHECMPELNTFDAVTSIPKKEDVFDTTSNNPQYVYAWGLEAKHVISAAYVVVYHIIIFIVPFGLWGWWMKTHPDDLQGASVPLTVVLGLLSVFWSTNGILTEGRHGFARPS